MKLNITKGNFEAAHYEIFRGNTHIASIKRAKVGDEEAAANAALIAEAFNVANETGLTPRELWERLNEAIKALQDLQYYLNTEVEGIRSITIEAFVKPVLDKHKNATVPNSSAL